MPIIQYLKDNGYFVYVVDPYYTSPGVAICDYHILADARDTNAIIKQLEGLNIDVITSDQSDIAIDTVAEVADALGLKGNPPEVVQQFTNKLLSRNYALSIGVPVPAFKEVFGSEDVKQFIEANGLPVILKPVDSQSSRGIFKIDESNLSGLDAYVKEAFLQTRKDYILVEQFWIGVEYTVEGICSNGRHLTVAISEKKHFRTGIASDLEYPAILPPEIEEGLIRCNDMYVEKSGLNFGITHAEYLYNAQTGKFCLVEIACRGGGSLISSDVAKWVSGIDLYQILVNDLTGVTTDVKALKVLKRNAIMHFFEFPDGKVTRIEGLEEVQKLKNVHFIKLEFSAGDILKKASDDRSRQGLVIVFSETKKELDETLKTVYLTLKLHIDAL